MGDLKSKTSTYILHNLIAIDQLVNTLFVGYPDETLSARAHFNSEKGDKKWINIKRIINFIFFWQEDHCLGSYTSELERKHLPGGYNDQHTITILPSRKQGEES